MQTSKLSLPIFAAGALVLGCALGPGDHFATIQPSLQAAWTQPEDRPALEGDFRKLASDYEVRLDEAVVELSTAELRSFSAGRPAGGGGGTFDPANPPPGYSLCHNGHCHRDDGALISYEEIQAELSGGGAAAQRTTLMTLPIHEAISLLEGASFSLECEPDCGLELTTVSDVHLEVPRVLLRGVVRDGRVPARIQGEVPFSVEGSLGLTHALNLPIDREHFPRLELLLALTPGPRIFDDVDWATDTPEQVRVHVLDAFAETAFQPLITRRP